MNHSVSRTALCLCIVVSIWTNKSVSQDRPFLDSASIVKSWEANYYRKLKNVDITYSEHLLATNLSEDTRGIPPELDPGRFTKDFYVARISDYHSKRYYVETATSKDSFVDHGKRLRNAFDGEITTTYDPSVGLGCIRPGLLGSMYENIEDIKPIMLLTTFPSTDVDQYPEGKPKLTYLFGRRETQVLPKIENVAGQPCHILKTEVTPSGSEQRFEYTVWIAHDKDMLPMKYEETINGELQESMEVEEIGVAETDVGAVWYPKSARRITSIPKPRGQITYRYLVDAFKPNIEVTKEAFTVKFPSGIRVIDKVRGIEYDTGAQAVDSLPDFHALQEDSAGRHKGAVDANARSATETNEPKTSTKGPDKKVHDSNSPIPSNGAQTSSWPLASAVVAAAIALSVVAWTGYTVYQKRGGKRV